MGSELTHRMVRANGIQIHLVEQGTGLTVILLHGFPEFWFSWRNQIAHLARHGYHVLAPDMRGYGDTDSPACPTSYTLLHLVGDVIGLLDALGHRQVFVVGHDVGAEVAWHLCMLRPDRVRALVNIGVPFRPRYPAMKPVEMLTKMFGEGFYIFQFQEPGRTEKSFARNDPYTVIKKFLLTEVEQLNAPQGVEIIDFLDNPLRLPAWVSEEELQFYASKFQRSGFTAALNYYRALDLNWELLAAWQGAKITVPTKFIVGDKDIGFESFGTKIYINGEDFKNWVPNVQVKILDGHHFIHQEKAKEVTEEILFFFNSFRHG